MKRCPECGASLEGRQSTIQFCSDKCRLSYRRKNGRSAEDRADAESNRVARLWR